MTIKYPDIVQQSFYSMLISLNKVQEGPQKSLDELDSYMILQSNICIFKDWLWPGIHDSTIQWSTTGISCLRFFNRCFHTDIENTSRTFMQQRSIWERDWKLQTETSCTVSSPVSSPAGIYNDWTCWLRTLYF